MISGKLVHLIETHSEQVLESVLRQIRREPDMPHMQAVPDVELRDWGQNLLSNLGHWFSAGGHQDLVNRFEGLGKLRCEQGIPLHEVVQALSITREKASEFVEEHIASNSSIELYAEEQLDRQLARFFDVLIVSVVRGYEKELRRSAYLTA